MCNNLCSIQMLHQFIAILRFDTNLSIYVLWTICGWPMQFLVNQLFFFFLFINEIMLHSNLVLLFYLSYLIYLQYALSLQSLLVFLLSQLSPDSGAALVTYPMEGVQQPVPDTSVTSLYNNSKVWHLLLIYLFGNICGRQCICNYVVD